MAMLGYEDVIDLLKREGFTISNYEPQSRGDGECYVFKGMGVVIGIGMPKQWYRCLDYRVAVDNLEAFNKWSQAPVSLLMPVDEDRLRRAIDKAGSKEGYEISEGFGTIDIDPYD